MQRVSSTERGARRCPSPLTLRHFPRNRFNEARSGFPVENFIVLLGGIKLNALSTMNPDGFLAPSPPPYCDVTRAERTFIKGRVTSRVALLESVPKGTWNESDITWKQLYPEVRKR